MTNTLPAAVRNQSAADPRVARTTHALGRAIIDLMREQPFDTITVQDILDRAGVGRTAFYSHFRNKEDALAASYERVFSALDDWIARPSPVGRRLFPVAEFLEHLGSAGDVVEALRRDGRLDDVWSLCVEHAARLMEGRIATLSVRSPATPRLVALMLAGALVETMRWWLDRPHRATPAAMDAAFHRLAWGTVRAATA